MSQSPLRLGFLLVPLALACFAVSAQAVSPAPDGGYANGNTAEGDFALQSLTTGSANTAIGASALFNNTNGNSNTASGGDALLNNNVGSENTANGFQALFSNTMGDDNAAVGANALFSNTTGSVNTAIGAAALFNNTTGNDNTASGVDALAKNTTGQFNTANGVDALAKNTTGQVNTAIGAEALSSNTTGHDNTASGFLALANNQGGSSNIALGSSAGINLTTGNNNIDIGAPGLAAEANTIRIGKSGTQKKTFIAGIRGVTVASGVGVIVGTTGQLGTVVSSARFKEAIKPMDKASETILNLKPVTFRYKEELDPDKIPQFGLIAEEVEKVDPSLVARDEDGKVNTVRYEAVNAMLLNEFLKEHHKVQEQEQKLQKQEATIVRQQKDFESKFAQQQKQIEALTATVRKGSEQVEIDASAPRIVANED